MKCNEIAEIMVALLRKRKMSYQNFYSPGRGFSSLGFFLGENELRIDYEKRIGEYIYRITNKDYHRVPSEHRERKLEVVKIAYILEKKEFSNMEKTVCIRYEMGDHEVHRFKPSDSEWAEMMSEFLKIMKGKRGWRYG